MSADDFKAAESKRQELLAQLNAAETAIRSGLHSQGFEPPCRPTWNGRWPTSGKPISP